jgi:hypothetical protein
MFKNDYIYIVLPGKFKVVELNMSNNHAQRQHELKY